MDAALDTLLKALKRMDTMTIALCEARGIPTIPTMDYARWPARPFGQRSTAEAVAEKTADPTPVTEVTPAEDVKAEGEPEPEDAPAKVQEQPAAAEQARPDNEGREEEPQAAEQQDDDANDDDNQEAKAAEESKPVAELPTPEPLAAPAPVKQRPEEGSKPGGAAAYSDSETSESDDNRTVGGKGGAKARKGNLSKKMARKDRSPGSKADNDSGSVASASGSSVGALDPAPGPRGRPNDEEHPYEAPARRGDRRAVRRTVPLRHRGRQ